jgi:hypothetical protein
MRRAGRDGRPQEGSCLGPLRHESRVTRVANIFISESFHSLALKELDPTLDLRCQ